MLKLVMGVFIACASTFAIAEPYSNVYGLIVEDVYAGYEGGIIFFGVDSNVTNPNNCPAGAQRIIGIDPNRGSVDHVLSVLLYAHASGKKVDIQVYDESCVGNHIVARRVKVKNS